MSAASSQPKSMPLTCSGRRRPYERYGTVPSSSGQQNFAAIVRAIIPTMKKYAMELTRNHFAVVSRCASGWLVSGKVLTLRGCGTVETADEVHDVAGVALRNVIDPRRHGSALHAVENGIETTPVGKCRHDTRVAQRARVAQ